VKERQHFLDLFFNPKSIAVVGASTNSSKMNYNLFANLVKLEFPGRIYPINPHAEEILGRKAYPDLKSIEDEVELVVSAVPARATLNVIKDCVAKRVKGIVIVTGGFSEIGEEGRKIQAEVAQLLRESGIRAVGPNALSPINTSNNLVIGFSLRERLKRGGLSLIFQSGLYEAVVNDLCLSKVIDLGNKMNINEVDVLEYFAEDPDTKVIAIHLESIAGDGRKFLQLLKETSKEKPIVVIKSGRTPAGARAASSHTGAIAKGRDVVLDVGLRQAGVIRAHSVEEFFDFAKAFDFLLPLKLDGNRVAVASFSGGEGTIVVDLCQEKGLSLAEVNPETSQKLQKVSPPWGVSANPFDLGVCMQFHPMGEVYKVFLDSMINDENVDCIAFPIGGIPMPEEILELMLMARERKKPVVLWLMEEMRLMTRVQEDGATIQRLESNHIPVYPSSERAIKALSAWHWYNLSQKVL
jgi:acetyltransferase